MNFLNKNAYIQTAIFGYSFCTAAKRAFFLIARNIMRVAAVGVVSEIVLILGKVGHVKKRAALYWGGRGSGGRGMRGGEGWVEECAIVSYGGGAPKILSKYRGTGTQIHIHPRLRNAQPLSQRLAESICNCTSQNRSNIRTLRTQEPHRTVAGRYWCLACCGYGAHIHDLAHVGYRSTFHI